MLVLLNIVLSVSALMTLRRNLSSCFVTYLDEKTFTDTDGPTLEPVIIGPGNAALSAVLPTRTALHRRVRTITTRHTLSVMATHGLVKPSGEISPLTTWRSVFGPVLMARTFKKHKMAMTKNMMLAVKGRARGPCFQKSLCAFIRHYVCQPSQPRDIIRSKPWPKANIPSSQAWNVFASLKQIRSGEER